VLLGRFCRTIYNRTDMAVTSALSFDSFSYRPIPAARNGLASTAGIKVELSLGVPGRGQLLGRSGNTKIYRLFQPLSGLQTVLMLIHERSVRSASNSHNLPNRLYLLIPMSRKRTLCEISHHHSNHLRIFWNWDLTFFLASNVTLCCLQMFSQFTFTFVISLLLLNGAFL